MVKTKVAYLCDICETGFTTLSEAKACEKRPVIDPFPAGTVLKGDYFTDVHGEIHYLSVPWCRVEDYIKHSCYFFIDSSSFVHWPYSKHDVPFEYIAHGFVDEIKKTKIPHLALYFIRVRNRDGSIPFREKYHVHTAMARDITGKELYRRSPISFTNTFSVEQLTEDEFKSVLTMFKEGIFFAQGEHWNIDANALEKAHYNNNFTKI